MPVMSVVSGATSLYKPTQLSQKPQCDARGGRNILHV